MTAKRILVPLDGSHTAEVAADVAADLARSSGGSVRLLGEIASRRDPPALETAEGYYREALALAGQLSMRPLAAHCHFDLGRLFRKTDQHEQARQHLATATTMYREMDMRFWLEQAKAEVRELA